MTRLAVSVDNLGKEVHARSPRTVLYFYDDTLRRDSDHDPNPAGVVCGIDIMQGYGLDLAALAEEIRARRHPAGKYVIYNRRIASASQDWKWRTYYGSNPHTDHIHVSVGVGPDGYSTGDYDNPAPWLEENMDLTAQNLKDISKAVWEQYNFGTSTKPVTAVGRVNEIARNVSGLPEKNAEILAASLDDGQVVVDVAAFAAAIAAEMPPGLTQDDVERAVSTVLNKAVIQVPVTP
jgi:hypothetical protein